MSRMVISGMTIDGLVSGGGGFGVMGIKMYVSGGRQIVMIYSIN